jgi:ankyrin repeat protein
MIDNGMQPDTQGPKGWTALRMAAVKNRYDVALELLRRGACVDAINYKGETALMMISHYDHYEIASLLLFFGADPNLENCFGYTALMIATSYGNKRIVGAFLDSWQLSDINKTNICGESALHLAIEFGHDNIAKMLVAAGAKHSATVFPRVHKNGNLNCDCLIGGVA